MKNATDAAARQELLSRLAALGPGSRPRWGRMDVAAMLCHLIESARMATGELAVRPKKKRAFQVFPLKHLVLYVLPFPKGAPTAPELIARAPQDLEADRATLRGLIEGFGDGCRGGAEHPLLGVLSRDEWDALVFKHMDHHLRQFGV